MIKRFDGCISEDGPIVRGGYKLDFFFLINLISLIRHPTKGKHSPCSAVRPDGGCLHLGLYARRTAKGSRGHSRCTDSRRRGIPCGLGKQARLHESLPVGSEGCSSVSPRSRWLRRGAVSGSEWQHQPSSVAVVSEARMSKRRAEQQGSSCSRCTASRL